MVEYIDAKQLAKLAGTTPGTVYDYVRDKQFQPALRIGDRHFFTRDQAPIVCELLEEGKRKRREHALAMVAANAEKRKGAEKINGKFAAPPAPVAPAVEAPKPFAESTKTVWVQVDDLKERFNKGFLTLANKMDALQASFCTVASRQITLEGDLGKLTAQLTQFNSNVTALTKEGAFSSAASFDTRIAGMQATLVELGKEIAQVKALASAPVQINESVFETSDKYVGKRLRAIEHKIDQLGAKSSNGNGVKLERSQALIEDR